MPLLNQISPYSVQGAVARPEVSRLEVKEVASRLYPVARHGCLSSIAVGVWPNVVGNEVREKCFAGAVGLPLNVSRVPAGH